MVSLLCEYIDKIDLNLTNNKMQTCLTLYDFELWDSNTPTRCAILKKLLQYSPNCINLPNDDGQTCLVTSRLRCNFGK